MTDGGASQRLLRRLRGSGPAGGPGSVQGRVTYARSLDGQHLWIALEGPASGLALRDEDSGNVVPFDALGGPGEVGVGDRLEACLALDAGAADWRRLVVVADTGPVPPAPDGVVGDDDSLTQSLALDGWRAVVTATDGAVRIARQPVDVRALVRGLDMSEGRLRVLLDTDLVAPTTVALEAAGGGSGPTVPLDPVGDAPGVYSFSLAMEGLELEPDTTYELRVCSADASAPLVRNRNGLRRPGGAVALPQLAGTCAGRAAVLRLRFVRSGALAVRLVRPSDGASGAAR